MADKITVVTSPDDIQIDAFRILLVDLSHPQADLLSKTLLSLKESNSEIVTYFWKNGEDFSWLLDKKHKSDVIIFNADSENDILVGYMAAQKNSHYFGNLRNLNIVNKSAIYNAEQLLEILEKNLINHDKI